MAVIFDKTYKKILSFLPDETSGTTELTIQNYSAEADRLREKKSGAQILAFKKNAADRICAVVNAVYEPCLKNAEKEGIATREEYFALHSDDKRKVESAEEFAEEGNRLISEISICDIDPAKLKYRKVWEDLGFCGDMLTRIQNNSFERIGVPGICGDLSECYERLKQITVGETVVDC